MYFYLDESLSEMPSVMVGGNKKKRPEFLVSSWQLTRAQYFKVAWYGKYGKYGKWPSLAVQTNVFQCIPLLSYKCFNTNII
jgi:hypothetical protein